MAIDNNFLYQHVCSPTRITESTSNILDLIFSTQPSYVCNVDVFPGISDHEAIRFKLVNNIIKKELKKKKGIFLFQRQL